MQLLNLHDAFTVSVLVTLEALGYAKPGEGGAFMKSGAGSLGGKLPVNTHGGLLSHAHVAGILHWVEAVRQLRGEAGDASEDDIDARDVAWVPLSAVLAVDDTWGHLIASPPGSAFARNPKTWKFEAVDPDAP